MDTHEPLTFLSPDFRLFDRHYRYINQDILARNFTALPRPEYYDDCKTFSKALMDWAISNSAIFYSTFFPTPIGFWYHMPNSRSGLSPENTLALQRIVIDEEPLHDGDHLPDTSCGEVPVTEHVTSERPWYAQPLMQRPVPYLYKTYEEFAAAMSRWHALAKWSLNAPPHPSEIGAKLGIPKEARGSRLKVQKGVKREFQRDPGSVIQAPKDVELVRRSLYRLRNDLALREPAPELIDIETDLLQKRRGYARELRQCSDFRELHERDKDMILKTLMSNEPMSLCRKFSILTGVCKLLKSPSTANALLNDRNVWERVAHLMNDFVLWPRNLADYSFEILTKITPSQAQIAAKQATMHFHQALLYRHCLPVGMQFCDEIGMSGYSAVKMWLDLVNQQCTGLATTMAPIFYEFLTSVLAGPVDEQSYRDILSLFRLVFKYVEDQAGFFQKFQMAEFVFSLALRHGRLMVDLVKEILFSKRSCSAFVPLFLKVVNRNVNISQWSEPLLWVLRSVLAVDPTTTEPAEVSIAVVGKVVQAATLDGNLVYFELLRDICAYTSRTGTKNKDLISDMLGSCFSPFQLIEDPTRRCIMLSCVELLVSTPASETFIQKCHSFFVQVVSFTNYCTDHVSLHAWKVIWRVVMCHVRIRETFLSQVGATNLLDELVNIPPDHLLLDVLFFLCDISSHRLAPLSTLLRSDTSADKLIPNRKEAAKRILQKLLTQPDDYDIRLNFHMRQTIAETLRNQNQVKRRFSRPI